MKAQIDRNPREWLAQTLDELNSGLYEREDIVALSLLGVLSGQTVFLYGPPGTAKSLIARRVSCIFPECSYFEYLMQRFSTPEDVFGPISITQLKQDNYHRITDRYLPTADVAFLDEIWKSSPAILNTLLTIINERRFRNGTVLEKVPLRALIAASNEIPAEGSGLDALYDRFVLRLCVDPVSDPGNFDSMISGGDVPDTVEIGSPVTPDQWDLLMERARSVELGPRFMEAVRRIRSELAGMDGMYRVYVSDRRWQKAVSVIRVATALCGRDNAELADALVLASMLWSSPENREPVEKAVLNGVYRTIVPPGREQELAETLERLSREVAEVFVTDQETEVVVFDNMGCYPVKVALGTSPTETMLYIPYGPKAAEGVYTAWDRNNMRYPFKVLSRGSDMMTVLFTQGNVRVTVPMVLHEPDRPSPETKDVYLRSIRSFMADAEEAMAGTDAAVSDEGDPFVPDRTMGALDALLRSYCDSILVLLGRARDLLRSVEEYVC